MFRGEVPHGPARISALALLAVLTGAGCNPGPTDEGTAEPEPRAPAPEVEVRREAGLDVLLVTVDTLRADALGAYGSARAATPWMDRLAAGGVRFTDAHAHNVLTLPSHANILSGLLPQEHGVRDNSGFRFPGELPTLATLLRQHGYRTGAFVSAFPLASRFGLDRGFDVYEDSFVEATTRPAFLEQERPGSETVQLARDWLAADDDRPFFCWLHLYEPHYPYSPPEPLATRFRGDPYLGDVAAADQALAPLLGPILESATGGNTLVVLTSDHGEALGEHGEATHGIFAYESVLAVPLVIYQPRLFEPRTVRAGARHIDLVPTILDALSLPVPDGLSGRSLLAAAAGRSDEATPDTYFEALSGQLNRGWAPLYGILRAGEKLIDLPIPELYRLDEDPREARNLAAAEPRRLAALRAALEPLRTLDPGAVPVPEDAETRRRLESLGYLGGGGGVKESYSEEDDPKRLIELDEIDRQITDRHSAGDLEGALRLCRELVRRRPGMWMTLLQLAQLEREAGDLDAAVEALRQALALKPEDPVTLTLLATYLTQAGREAEAVAVTEPHSRLAEPDIEVLLTRGLAFSRLRRPREAWAAFQRARELDPENPLVPVYQGTFHLMGGQRDEARAAYREALALNPATARAHSSLGIMAAEEGRIDEAAAHWRQAVEADPQEHGKLFSVATSLWRGGRQAEARPLLELFLASAPQPTYRREIERARQLLAGAA